jgi:hypothetical protein
MNTHEKEAYNGGEAGAVAYDQEEGEQRLRKEEQQLKVVAAVCHVQADVVLQQHVRDTLRNNTYTHSDRWRVRDTEKLCLGGGGGECTVVQAK